MVQITQFLRRAVQTRARRRRDRVRGPDPNLARIRDRARQARRRARRASVASRRPRRHARAQLRPLPRIFLRLRLGRLRRSCRSTRGSRRPRSRSGSADSGCAALLIDDAFLPMLDASAPHAPRCPRHRSASATARRRRACSPTRPASQSGAGRRRRRPGRRRSGRHFLHRRHDGTLEGRDAEPSQHRRQRCSASRRLRADEDSVYIHAAPMFHLADGAVDLSRHRAGRQACVHAALRTRRHARSDRAASGHRDADRADHDQHGRASSQGRERPTRPRCGAFIYGASPMPEAVIRRACKSLPHTGFVQAYGRSEAAPCMTFLTPRISRAEGPKAGKLKAAGRAPHRLRNRHSRRERRRGPARDGRRNLRARRQCDAGLLAASRK